MEMEQAQSDLGRRQVAQQDTALVTASPDTRILAMEGDTVRDGDVEAAADGGTDSTRPD